MNKIYCDFERLSTDLNTKHMASLGNMVQHVYFVINYAEKHNLTPVVKSGVNINNLFSFKNSVIEKNDNALIEINRKVLEIDFIKDSYSKIKTNNIYEGYIDFNLEDSLYLINIKIIDLKSRRTWLKSIDINKKASKLLSNLYLYHFQPGM